MDPLSVIVLFILTTFVGILVGCVGIGGVLLVPMLTYLLSVDVHIAIASAIFSYVFSGFIGTFLYARKGSIKWQMTYALFVGAAPGAFLGAFISFFIPKTVLELFIALLIVSAGLNALIRSKDYPFEDKHLSSYTLLLIGFFVGVGSALSGTGGPLILVPILVWCRIAPRTSVGLSQAIQIPIAILGTTGNYLHGTVDFMVGFYIAISLMVGVSLGAKITHLVTQPFLEKIVAWVLLAVGLFIVVRGIFSF
ncbi:MAG: hypothetical protein CMF70_06520 [Magnetovibrio sp.]|nr:hypothetical protein [Magnetovibrio sp.]